MADISITEACTVQFPMVCHAVDTGQAQSGHKDRLANRPGKRISQIYYSVPAQEVRSVQGT